MLRLALAQPLLLVLFLHQHKAARDSYAARIYPNSSFVTANGTEFVLGSEPFFFVGTNAWYLGHLDTMDDADVGC